MTKEEALDKIAQAYQVIGCLMGETAPEAECIRALDYFADNEAFDAHFLPWPKIE